MSVLKFLPDYEEIFEDSGVQGIIDGLVNDNGLDRTDVFQLFVTDPDPVLQSMIHTNPDLNMFLSSPVVLDLLKNEGWGPGQKEAFLALPGAPDAFNLDFFMDWAGASLLPTQVKQAAGYSETALKSTAALLSHLASKTGQNSRLGAALRTMSAGLLAASSHSKSAILIGSLAASQIWDGVQAIYTMWNSLTMEQKKEAPETMMQALKVAERIENLLKNADVKDKDTEMITKLAKTLSSGNITNTARQLLNQEYENHALSVLKRQLQNVFNERTPLYEFSPMAAVARATRAAGNNPSLSGYPSSVIGIH